VLSMAEHDDIDTAIVRYLNRLSDFLFVLARYLSNFFGVEEIQWKSKL